MPKFTVYLERGGDASTIEAPSRDAAALAFAKTYTDEFGIDFDRAMRLIVSDEKARVWVVEARATCTITWDCRTKVECAGADLEADDPMPTPAAEALRDARFARKVAP